jgi:hypothetical protein
MLWGTLVGTVVVVAIYVLLFSRHERHVPVTRFGHAFPHPKDSNPDPIGEAAGVLQKTAPLGPRMPHEKSAVWEAERVLRIERALHDELVT